MRRRRLLCAVILTVTPGCDNVAWGGIDVRLEGPPAAVLDSAAAAVAAPEIMEEEAPPPELPSGPILLAGARSGASASLAVVGAVEGGTPRGFPSEGESPGFREHFSRTLLAPGTEIVLFAGGARVGRMTVRSVEVDSTYCVPRPVARGPVELSPDAGGVRRVTGLLDPAAARRAFTPYRALAHGYAQRIAALNLAGTTIERVGAPWPTSLLGSRSDMQAFQLPGAEGPSFAATFTVGDRMAVEPPGRNAYALFVMGSPVEGQYRSDLVWYRRAETDGKGVPRYFDHVDWDGDGADEVLLEVLGAENRWFAGLAAADGSWTRTYEDACGQAAG